MIWWEIAAAVGYVLVGLIAGIELIARDWDDNSGGCLVVGMLWPLWPVAFLVRRYVRWRRSAHRRRRAAALRAKAPAYATWLEAAEKVVERMTVGQR